VALKKTLLDWTLVGWRRRGRAVPVFVELHRFPGEASGSAGVTLLERMITDELRSGRVARPGARLRRARHRGGITVYFDGLDEVQESLRAAAVHAINDFARDFSRC